MSVNQIDRAGTEQTTPDFSKIVENNPSGIILRKNLKEATGGLLDGGTMANLDSEETGIPERIILGRKVAYPVEAVVAYLQEKAICIRHQKQTQETDMSHNAQIISIADKLQNGEANT
nr:hypothetical protein [Desulfobacula sp.]